MKEILIDIYKSRNICSGLGQFSLNFANELMNQSINDIGLNLLVPENSTIQAQQNCKIIVADFKKRYFPFLNKNYAIWHSLNQFPSFTPNKRTVQILTIHDLNFLFEKDDAKSAKYLKKLQKNFDRADYITTISNFTKKQIEENIDQKGKMVRVIYNGINIEAPQHPLIPKFANSQKFFFSISIFNRKKNFHVLLPLIKHFKDHRLIIAGDNNTPYGREIRNRIKRMNLSDRVILPGKISNSDKYWLYNNCEAFLFPSIAEGFGMPVIEAMKLGKAVFLSKHTSLPEIGGDQAFYFDHFDDKYMSSFIHEKLLKFSSEKDCKKKIQEYANNFNWQKCMKEYLQLYAEILNN
jgi:glycosyltransferase involved in cell wall biosynthesis